MLSVAQLDIGWRGDAPTITLNRFKSPLHFAGEVLHLSGEQYDRRGRPTAASFLPSSIERVDMHRGNIRMHHGTVRMHRGSVRHLGDVSWLAMIERAAAEDIGCVDSSE